MRSFCQKKIFSFEFLAFFVYWLDKGLGNLKTFANGDFEIRVVVVFQNIQEEDLHLFNKSMCFYRNNLLHDMFSHHDTFKC